MFFNVVALTEMFNPPEELPTPDFNVQTRPSPKPAPVKKVKDARVRCVDLFDTSGCLARPLQYDSNPAGYP